METNALTAIIVDEAYRIHQEIGPGLFESVYECVLANALKKRGLRVERQVIVPICVRGEEFDEGFRADLIVEGLVIVEIKSVERLAPVFKKQVLTYPQAVRHSGRTAHQFQRGIDEGKHRKTRRGRSA
ncbi:MAG TPA: GxxExxY protein [Candidatus Methylacidiphilales bacterium]|nr:GxxExxY protein [Candidatus Methylacidiphilales bacterium]